MRQTLAALATVGALLGLAACGDTGAGAGSEPAAASHTMPDGTVMSGSSMPHGDEHGSEDAGPSAAARMVCTGNVVDDVGRIMGLAKTPDPSSSWQSPTFTCTFELAQGPLVLTVHDATDRTAGMAYYQQQRTSAQDMTPIKGVYSLGLPAFETKAGTVSFVRDGKTLEVDATRLPDGERLGGHHDMDRTEVAYAVATSVLACWTEHA